MSLVSYEASSSDEDETAGDISLCGNHNTTEKACVEPAAESDFSKTELNVISNHVVRSFRNRDDGKTKIILEDSDVSSSSDEEELQPSPKKVRVSDSSLLTLLPPPKNSEESGRERPANAIPRVQCEFSDDELSGSSGEDDQNSTGGDFFSLSKLGEPVDNIVPPLTSADLIQPKPGVELDRELPDGQILTSHQIDNSQQTIQPAGLDEEAKKELAKLKRLGRPIEWSNVQADALTGGSKEQLLKNITVNDEMLAKVHCEPPSNPLSKRKHQMTYLAYLAKTQEYDLKLQWSQNAANRRESRAKYGF